MSDYRVKEVYVEEGTTFSISEDGMVVAKRPHFKGVKLLIAEPVEADDTDDPVCGAATASGTCGRTVKSAGERCWQHE